MYLKVLEKCLNYFPPKLWPVFGVGAASVIFHDIGDYLMKMPNRCVVSNTGER